MSIIPRLFTRLIAGIVKTGIRGEKELKEQEEIENQKARKALEEFRKKQERESLGPLADVKIEKKVCLHCGMLNAKYSTLCFNCNSVMSEVKSKKKINKEVKSNLSLFPIL
ncbi:MAG: hypothetical protein ACXABK_04300 [Candidatus Heimdallarchaeaceae archaeon]|jgi:ribosomal protein L40E